jgi:hypothetical protein
MSAGAVATTAVLLSVALAARAVWWRWYTPRSDAKRLARDEPDLRSGAERWLDANRFRMLAVGAVVAAVVAIVAGIAAVM